MVVMIEGERRRREWERETLFSFLSRAERAERR